MKYLCLLLVPLLALACGDRDPICNESVAIQIPPGLALSVPYENGDSETFVTSDGEVFQTGVLRAIDILPDRAVTCEEILRVSLSGAYSDGILLLNYIIQAAEASGVSEVFLATAPYRSAYNVALNTASLPLNLSPNSRVITDTTIGEINYQRVIVDEVDQSTQGERGIKRIYTSAEFGLIQVTHNDSFEITRIIE